MRKSAAQVLDRGLTQANRVFADYISPERRLDAADTIDRLLRILGDRKFVEAWAELKEDAQRKGTDLPVTLLPHPP